MSVAQLPAGLDTADPGQVDVHQRRIGPQGVDGGERFLTGRDGADDDEGIGRFDHRLGRSSKRQLIVNDQHSDACHHSPPCPAVAVVDRR
ncbi:MAG TPA: hypothetical protein VES60_01360 [Nakamurella sp.]|nr:hypothetical protein [Nakamurella sp.]